MSTATIQRIYASAAPRRVSGGMSLSLPRTEDGRSQIASPVRSAGFSLVELLVAMAVFSVVMAGITLLFVSSVRSVKQGTQNIDAFSTARNTFHIIESDLTTAFTSRDRGDYYNFFGTPIGFTFIGVVNTKGFAGTSNDNLARITYVLHRSDGADGTAIRSQQFKAESTNANVTPSGGNIKTYALIRYVEPGVSNLDDFPVNWNQPAHYDNPGFVATLNDEANMRADLYDTSALDPAQAGQVRAELRKSARRELWIQMLAGDPDLPRAWVWYTTDASGNPIRHDGFLHNASGAGADAADFVISDGIILESYDTNPKDISTQIIADNVPTDFYYSLAKGFPNIKPLFTYGGLNQAQENSSLGLDNYWNAWKNLVLDSATSNSLTPIQRQQALRNLLTARGSVVNPRIPALVGVRLQWMFPSPYPGAPDFKRAFDEKIDIPTGYTRQDLTKKS